MEDQGGLVNLIIKIRFGSTIECVWPELKSVRRVHVLVEISFNHDFHQGIFHCW